MFSDINCEIAKGEFVTLLGPSGCGKSTLLRCIAGLTSVDSGQILLDGQDIVPLSPQKRHIGMVFQSYALFPNMTVEQNVAFGLRMQRSTPTTATSACRKCCNWSNSRTSPAATRTRCPAASASAWPWHAPGDPPAPVAAG